MKLRIGTRGSPLARWQANWVAQRLDRTIGVEVEIVQIATQGDVRGESIQGLSGQGVFTKEIQLALLDGRVDLAVHSLKDLPTESVPGLRLVAVPPRESTADVLISRQGILFRDLPQGARIGTSSARRRAQLLHARPDLVPADIRGNVDTRIRKLRDGQFDAIVLAEAGLRRLGLADAITEILPTSLMLPAVGQGALGIEARQDDTAAAEACEKLDDPATHQAVLAERALLSALRGGCLAPVAALARQVSGDELELSAAVLSVDGRQRLFAAAQGGLFRPVDLGRGVAAELLTQGAASLIEQSRGF
jgi:hydroxymethylbilane synthase